MLFIMLYVPELVEEIGPEAPPTPRASEPIEGEGADPAASASSPEWLEKLGAFVERQTGHFTTDEAVRAAGLDPDRESDVVDVIGALRAHSRIGSALSRGREGWTKREVA